MFSSAAKSRSTAWRSWAGSALAGRAVALGGRCVVGQAVEQGGCSRSRPLRPDTLACAGGGRCVCRDLDDGQLAQVHQRDFVLTGDEHALPDRQRPVFIDLIQSVLRASWINGSDAGAEPGYRVGISATASPSLVQVNRAGIQTWSRKSAGASTFSHLTRWQGIHMYLPSTTASKIGPSRGSTSATHSCAVPLTTQSAVGRLVESRVAQSRGLVALAGCEQAVCLDDQRNPSPGVAEYGRRALAAVDFFAQNLGPDGGLIGGRHGIGVGVEVAHDLKLRQRAIPLAGNAEQLEQERAKTAVARRLSHVLLARVESGGEIAAPQCLQRVQRVLPCNRLYWISVSSVSRTFRTRFHPPGPAASTRRSLPAGCSGPASRRTRTSPSPSATRRRRTRRSSSRRRA